MRHDDPAPHAHGPLIGTRLRRGWLGFEREIAGGAEHASIPLRNVAHSVLYLQSGCVSGRLIHRGKESRTDGETGAVRFHAADGEEQTLVGTIQSPRLRFATLIIPPDDLHTIAAADGVDRLADLRMLVWPNDAVLRGCLALLTSPIPAADSGDEEDRDEAARCLVLRLAELTGAPRPDWYADSGSFDRRSLGEIVAMIDADLAMPPTAADVARGCGLSPSHFARKFRHTTGMSLGRFVNRRRLQAALDRLRHPATDLVTLAFDLGFSSQSHLTRLFSESTGMTPAKFRRMFRPTIG